MQKKLRQERKRRKERLTKGSDALEEEDKEQRKVRIEQQKRADALRDKVDRAVTKRTSRMMTVYSDETAKRTRRIGIFERTLRAQAKLDRALVDTMKCHIPPPTPPASTGIPTPVPISLPITTPSKESAAAAAHMTETRDTMKTLAVQMRGDVKEMTEDLTSLEKLSKGVESFQNLVFGQLHQVLAQSMESTSSRDAGPWVEGRRLGSTRCGSACLRKKAGDGPTSEMHKFRLPPNLWDA